MKNIEALKTSSFLAGQVLDNLRYAGHEANAIEHLMIMELIEKAAILHRNIDAMINAVESTEKENR